MGASAYVGMPGLEWQELCLLVLRAQHGDDLIPVPDNHNGDAGLEAFTTSGVAYQSYSPQGSLTVAQRYERQRKKVTTDIGKFISNSSKLQPLLGDVEIERWVLLTPVVDSRELVAHCTKQTLRVKDVDLTYASSEFRVLAQTLEDDYAAALRTIAGQGLVELGIPEVALPDYSTVRSELADAMRAKLSRLPQYASSTKLDAMMAHLLSANVQGQAHRDFVRDYFPDLDHRLSVEFEALKNRVEFELPNDGHPPGRLLSLAMQLASQVTSTMNADELKSQQVAYGQVAEWLMHCPLDFLPQNSTG